MARRTQHRAARDTNTQDVTELKQQIRILKRQLARANKEIQRLEKDDGEEGDSAAAPQSITKKSEDSVTTPSCPACSHPELGMLQTPSGKTIGVCKGCKKWRGVLRRHHSGDWYVGAEE